MIALAGKGTMPEAHRPRGSAAATTRRLVLLRAAVLSGLALGLVACGGTGGSSTSSSSHPATSPGAASMTATPTASSTSSQPSSPATSGGPIGPSVAPTGAGGAEALAKVLDCADVRSTGAPSAASHASSAVECRDGQFLLFLVTFASPSARDEGVAAFFANLGAHQHTVYAAEGPNWLGTGVLASNENASSKPAAQAVVAKLGGHVITG